MDIMRGRLSGGIGTPASPRGRILDPLEQLGAKLHAWYRGDSVTLGTSPDIAEMANLSDNSDVLTQSVAASRPHLVAAAQNGHDAVSHDGSNHFLQMTSAYASALATDWAITMAIKFPDGNPSSNDVMWGVVGSGSANEAFFFITGTGAMQYKYKPGSDPIASYTSNAGLADGELPYDVYTFWADFDGDDKLKYRINQVDQVDNGVATGDTSGLNPANYAGTLFPFIGARNSTGTTNFFAEILWLDFAFYTPTSLNDIVAVETYMTARYAL